MVGKFYFELPSNAWGNTYQLEQKLFNWLFSMNSRLQNNAFIIIKYHQVCTVGEHFIRVFISMFNQLKEYCLFFCLFCSLMSRKQDMYKNLMCTCQLHQLPLLQPLPPHNHWYHLTAATRRSASSSLLQKIST